MPMVALAVARPMHSFSPRFGGRWEAYHGSSSCQTSRLTNIDRPFDNFFRTTPSSGLRTPPPERRHETSSMQPQMCGPLLTKFEPPVLSQSNVPKMLDTFRSSQQLYQPHKIFDSPPSRRSSVHISTYSYPPSTTSHTPSTSQSVSQLKHRSGHNTLTSSAGMQIPPIVKGQRLSLPDFAAQITCFLWFESSYILHRIEESTILPVVQAPLAKDAIPTPGFRKWLATILSTTQVSQNVVLLALLFIYRLKKLNPSVKGKTGSEFRLITVALMLGNKFLDDNTYTNKTWAEVSGITVQEIHIMEVEFLQNMKYNLFTSEVMWREWQVKLYRFWSFWEMASQTTFDVSPRTSGPVSPALPSPPVSQTQSPSFIRYTQPSTRTYTNPTPETTPVGQLPLVELGRKRSYDAGSFVMEPPTKRVSRSMKPNISVPTPQFPMPITSLTAPASERYAQRESPPLAPIISSASSLPIPSIPSMSFGLPLTEPGSRAMSMVFPNQAQASVQTLAPVPVHPLTHNISISSVGSQSRISSPYLPQGSNTSSPSSVYPTQQPQHLSPSYFLGNRSSPYRPVRGVQSLLIPQTQAPVPPPMNMDQIQYQPLGKARSQYRNGILPYMSSELAWGPSTHRPTP
ncbi:hypothetical protein BGX38DRAFT_1267907 [Terfezia claveryi]|nr:hypothetical protein BGX38DRAFT_1267907 [Terfezia claveryi]